MATLSSLTAATCDGKPKVSGIAKLFVIPHCDVDVFGTIGNHTAEGVADVGFVSTANVPKATKGFIEIPMQIHKNSLKMESQGDNGVGNVASNFEGLVPSFAKLTVGTLNHLRYIPLLALVVMPDGTTWQIGDSINQAFLKYNGDTLATDATDAAGFTIMVNAISPYAYHVDPTLAITTL